MNLNARTVDSETTELTMKQTEIKDLRKHITEAGRLRSLSEMMNTNDLHHKALEKANNISLKRPNLTESFLIQTSKLSYNSHYCVGNVSTPAMGYLSWCLSQPLRKPFIYLRTLIL